MSPHRNLFQAPPAGWLVGGNSDLSSLSVTEFHSPQHGELGVTRPIRLAAMILPIRTGLGALDARHSRIQATPTIPLRPTASPFRLSRIMLAWLRLATPLP